MSDGWEGAGGGAAADLDARIQAFIEGCAGRRGAVSGALFEELALELFAFQYERNAAYRRFCRSRRVEPGRLAGWTEIPSVPLEAFKELTLVCDPPEGAAAVFMTSGSTDAGRRGRNHHPHLGLYDASLRVNFGHFFMPDRDRMRVLVLNPRPEAQPHSSIAYFFGRLVDFFGAAGSDFFVDERGLRVAALLEALRQAQADGEPVAVLGTSFAYVHVLDALADAGVSVDLSAGSRVLDTGGFKGRSREVPAEELRAALGARLGVPVEWCVNYYGMTEISTQYYETILRAAWRGAGSPDRVKAVPPWARIQVLDPETRAPVPDGQPGLLAHLDVANRGSCLAVLSEDVGYRVADDHAEPWAAGRFVLVGRAAGAQARGCSLALDEFLTAAGTGSW